MDRLNSLIFAFRLSRLHDSRGVALVLVTVLMFVIIGFAALAIDIGHLYVIRGELQNAADAGALYAAHELYNDYGTVIQTSANQAGSDAATQNKALVEGGAIPVEVDPVADVQRGHWSFATRTFTPNDSTVVLSLAGRTTEDLDTDPAFINAVRVVAWRQATPAASFFARIFGFPNFTLSAEAVGYIGFAGTLLPGDADVPIAICSQSLTGCPCGEPCPYLCNVGYMLSDGQDKNTAAWTNFTDPCETASTTSLRELLPEDEQAICDRSNPEELIYDHFIGATNGVNNAVFNSPSGTDITDCWMNATDDNGDGIPERMWNLTLPVVDCPDFQVSNCMKICGAVNVNVVWITGTGNDPHYLEAPTTNGYWTAPVGSENDGVARWNAFASDFNLQRADGSPANYMKKSIYFLPDCTEHPLKGLTGGTNYGVLAKIPVLVQ